MALYSSICKEETDTVSFDEWLKLMFASRAQGIAAESIRALVGVENLLMEDFPDWLGILDNLKVPDALASKISEADLERSRRAFVRIDRSGCGSFGESDLVEALNTAGLNPELARVIFKGRMFSAEPTSISYLEFTTLLSRTHAGADPASIFRSVPILCACLRGSRYFV